LEGKDEEAGRKIQAIRAREAAEETETLGQEKEMMDK
jgi:hypothetical protein